METDTTEETIAKGNNNRQMGPLAENSNGENPQTPPTMPEMPEDFDGEMGEMGGPMMGGGFGGGRGEFGNEMMMQDAPNNNTWHPAAYLGWGAGSVILGIVISYACFSKFFRNRPGQTFSSLKKFSGFIGVAIVIAALLAVLGYFIPIWTAA